VSEDSLELNEALHFPKSAKDRFTMSNAANWKTAHKDSAYRSSPPKQQEPTFNQQALQGKTVFMFKPTKLSSALSEHVTPEKQKSAEVTVEISVDLSKRDLSVVPPLETFLTGSAPTVIDLSGNKLAEVPA